MIEEQRKAKTAVDIANITNREESEKVNLINTIVKRKRRRNIVLTY